MRNINLSECLEKALENKLRSQKEHLWKEESKEAIEEYNKRVEDGNTFMKCCG
ncbi:MAG: type II toxin-antitoxin system CcdA family antitoxin [Campylobacterales bacterium]